jgi:WD40 repeat protein
VAGSDDVKERRLHTNCVRDIAFSPDGKLLATGGNDHFVKLWEFRSGKPLNERDCGTNVTSVGFSPDGKTLAAACDEPTMNLLLWDITDPAHWRPRADLRGHGSHVLALAFQPGGSLAATGGWDGTVRLWDLPSGGQRVRSVGGAFGPGVHGVAFSPEGGYLVTANDNGTISILRVPTPPPAYSPGPARPLPDPGELARRPSPADALKREDIPEELLKKAGGGDPEKAPPELVAVLWGKDGQSKQVRAVAISPDGKTLAADNFQTINLWNVADGSLRHKCIGHRGEIFALGFSPDGKLLASAGGQDGTVRLWDAATGKALGPLLGPRLGSAYSVVFSPDSRVLVSSSHDGSIQIWDVATGSIRRVLRGHNAPVGRIAFSPDGKLLASSGDTDQRALLWDVATGWQVGEFRNQEPNNRVCDVAFSPDALSLAVESDLKTEVWDLATRQQRFSLAPGHVLAFRADGKLIASGRLDGSVRLAEVGTDLPRNKILTLFPKGGVILKVAFTPEGRYLATANPDGTVSVGSGSASDSGLT